MRLIALTAALAAVSTLALAEEKRDLDAHEHGVGALNIAFEKDEVVMEFEAPGADIVGFEHPATSAEDRAKVDAAIATLAKPLELFRLPDEAQCTLVAAEVELYGREDDDHEAHAREDHHGDDEHHDAHAEEHHGDHEAHHEEHAEEHHEEHAEERHEEHHAATHTEFHAEYHLACATPGAIDRIEFGYFETFPNAEELEIQLISDKGSKSFEVERGSTTLDLKGSI